MKKTDPKAADELYKSVSYHVDHGNGLDCYKVGPTLGGGTAALMVNDTIVYPYCYKTFEVLDNGPLRFTVKLTYNPLIVNGDSVVETRLISLDAGSQLNKTVVTYDNLKETTPVVAGIVLHDSNLRLNIKSRQKKDMLLMLIRLIIRIIITEQYLSELFCQRPKMQKPSILKKKRKTI